MKDTINLWIPIDTNVNSNSYEIPTIENQREFLCGLLALSKNEGENDNANESDDEDNHHYYNQQAQDPRDKKFKEAISEWIDVMSFSHNVANQAHSTRRRNAEDVHLGEFTLTKFTCERSPTFNYMTLRGETIPHVVIRIVSKMKETSNILPIIEYELHHVHMTNVSISGGAGGKPVETLSLAAKVFIAKHIKLNLETGEFETYQVAKWDKLKNSGSKTIYSSKKGSPSQTAGQTLLELAKKRLMVDLDSHDETTIKLLKELGIVSEYELPDKSKDDEIVAEEFFRVLINKEPPLYKSFELKKEDLTIDNVKKTISQKLDMPIENIKAIYGSDNGVLIESNKVLKICAGFIVQTVDGKFYGY